MPFGGALSVGLALGGVASSAVGARQARGGSRAQRELTGLQLESTRQRLRIAKSLEDIANKLLSDEPLSANELRVSRQIQQVREEDIQRIGQQATKQLLQTLAGTGFLKSGRAAKQVRTLQLDVAQQRSGFAAQREQQLLNRIEARRGQAGQFLSAALGAGIPQFQVPQPSLPTASLVGAGLTELGGAGLQFASAQRAAQIQADALRTQAGAFQQTGAFGQPAPFGAPPRQGVRRIDPFAIPELRR